VKRYGLLVFIAAGAAFALLSTGLSPLGPEENVRTYVTSQAVMATPTALAAFIVWAAWWRRTGARLSTMDAPARLLAVAVATLPGERRDWGAAMTAELAEVPDRRTRWRFAAGCARCALFPPGGHRLPVLEVAAGATAAVAVTGLAVGRALPGMRLFAVTFVVLVGALATLAVARSRPVHRPAQRDIAIAGVLGVAACVAVTGYTLKTEVSANLHSSPAITLAAVLAGGLWLTLAPPRWLTTSRLARRAGVGAGLALAAVAFALARLNEIHQDGVMFGLALGPVPVIFAIAGAVAAIDRSFWSGLQTAVWTTVVTTLLTFAVWVVEALRWHHIHGTSLLDGATVPAGEALTSGILWILVVAPVWTLTFGVIGAGLGSIGTRRTTA
jgi:hypothetical protein